jgi:hypothetical protein
MVLFQRHILAITPMPKTSKRVPLCSAPYSEYNNGSRHYQFLWCKYCSLSKYTFRCSPLGARLEASFEAELGFAGAGARPAWIGSARLSGNTTMEVIAMRGMNQTEGEIVYMCPGLYKTSWEHVFMAMSPTW